MFSPELDGFSPAVENSEPNQITMEDYQRIVGRVIFALKFQGSFKIDYTAGEESFFLNIYYPDGSYCWGRPYSYGISLKFFTYKICGKIKELKSSKALLSQSNAN